MTEQSLTPRAYVFVWAILVALTVLTISVSFAPLSSGWRHFLGLLIASLKTILVVLFFMHLWNSKPLTWIVVIVTVFWLALLVALTLTDYVSRGLVPLTPGH